MVNRIINLDKEREKRVVTLVIEGNEIDFEALKNFLDSVQSDDYEIRVDALTLAIHQMSQESYYYGATTTLKVAEDFYEFLKNDS